jgi:predicted MPP superfamily phosphohydrolase
VLTRRNFLTRVSLATAGSFGFASTGFASARSLPGLRRTTLEMARLPVSWDGLTILQISDVHAGMHMSAARMRRIHELVDRLPADLVVFTGDQIDRRRVDAELFAEGFAGIAAPLGCFGVLGNHDYYVDPSLSKWALSSSGIVPLVNDSIELQRGGETLLLAGLDDLWSPAAGPDFDVLRRSDAPFTICLCHQPQGWHAARATGADLTLSGHTHGGQIALPTRNINVARLKTPYVAGPFRHRESALYVSRGIGVGAVPLRVGAPPEIDVITLRSAGAAEALRAA